MELHTYLMKVLLTLRTPLWAKQRCPGGPRSPTLCGGSCPGYCPVLGGWWCPLQEWLFGVAKAEALGGVCSQREGQQSASRWRLVDACHGPGAAAPSPALQRRGPVVDRSFVAALCPTIVPPFSLAVFRNSRASILVLTAVAAATKLILSEETAGKTKLPLSHL